MLMAIFSVGQVWGAEQLAYTLTPAEGSNNSYAGNCDVEISNITWNVTGNAQMTPWRLGGKSLNGVDRAVYSKTAMSDAITKVELTVGAASGITVNSLKLVVASNADFSTVIDEVTETFAANSTITFTPTSPATEWAKDAYYKFIFKVSVSSGSSNKFVEFTEAKFYKEVATATCETPTFSPAAGTFFGEQEITLATSTAGASIYYTTDGTTPSSSNGTLYDDPFSIDETTTIKAIAVKAGATDSEVAEATYTAGTPVSSYDIDFEMNNLAAYVNWDFVNIVCASTAITAHGDTYYGNTDGKTSSSITTKAKYANPGTLTFYISKESGNTTASSWKAQVSEDGEAWTDVETFDAKGMDKGEWNECTADLSSYSNVYVRISYGSSTAIRAIDDIELAAASAVAKPVISGTESFLTSTEVSIACTTDGATVYYTTDDTDPKTSESKQTYSAAFTLTNTATVRAIATKDAAWSSEATSKTFTKITPINVAAALSATSGDAVYVQGTITSITEVNIGYKNATYVISDVTAGVPANEMIIYRGKYVDGADFDSEDQIHVGDVVVVSGTIGVYQEKNQLAQGNQIESITPAAVVAPVFSPDGGGFMGETDVTITCATDGATIYYTLNGTNPTKSSMLYEGAIHLDATTTITAIAYVGEESSLVVAKEFTLTAPMTVAEAYDALTGDDINNAAVTGIVYQVDNISSGHATYWISDNGEAGEKVLEVYNGYGLNGASIAAGGIQVGDEVTVFGNLTIYVKNETSTKEFAAGSRLLAFNRPQVDVESINLTESTAEVEEGKTVTLHASVVPAKATNKTIVWSVQSGDTYASVDQNGVVTGIAAGEAVIRAASDENASIYEECTVTVTEPAPLSPWASVYTSNVTLSTEGGTSASAAKVKFYGEEGDGYDAIKAGTSSAQGAVVVNVPAGATALHFHAYGWNSESVGLTVTAPTGVTVSPATEISINSNSGIANNSPFTLAEGSDPKTDAYYAVSLSGNTEATNITISATSGKRFVLFGVNQEGGLVLESIAVSGTASVLEYNDGDHFDPTGLVVTGHYSDDSEATISEGIDWTFDPDPLTEGTESVSVTATAGGFTSAAFVVDGLTVAGAAPLSPWASVYTSNVTIASSESKQVTIDETDYPAAKSNKGASATITLPQGVTTIHLHLVAWSGEAQTVSVTGDCFNEAKELTIVANDGVSGGGAKYDLGASGVDYYFSLTPDNAVAADEVITITAASNKRFVLFGVNQEGGIIPELQSLAISGDLENKEYEAGQSLNMAGLTVMGTYNVGDPVDVTDQVEEWLYDALQVGDESVTISAKIGDVTSAGYEITGLTVTDPTPTITASPSFWNFNSVEQGAAVAAKAITVTLKNVAAATVAISGTGASAYSVDETALTASGTITITPSTAEVGSFNAIVTISDDASVAASATVTLLMTVNAVETPISTTSEWIVAESADLVNGKQVLITGVKDDVTYALSAQANNNRTTAAGTLNEGVFTPGENTMAFTLEAQEGGTFALRASNGNYLYAASSSSNYLKTRDAIGDDGKAVWTISIGEGNVASIVANCETANWRNVMQFNQNGNNNPVVACYASASQSAIKLYVPKPAPAPVEDWVEVRTGLEADRFYTLCYNKTMTAIKGASLWQFLNKEADFAYIVEAEAPYVAGTPYLIYAESDKLEAVVEDVTDPEAGHNNGLYGTFVDMDADALSTAGATHMLKSNMIKAIGVNNHLDAYRAYIKIGEIPGEAAPAPGCRVKAMPMQPQEATGLDNIFDINADGAQKLILNGQLIIIREGKMYDTTGRVVK